MKALITGGAGFIGSNLCNALYHLGYSITIVDDLSNGHVEFLHNDIKHKLIKADFSSEHLLQLIKEKNYDVVFHLAANPRVSYSVEHPTETHETNVLKTLKLLDSCVGNISRFVFASSSAIYGNSEILPTAESCPENPQSPYALQKATIEKYLKLYYSLYGLDSASLRFFNVFGPNQLGNSPYSTAISAWLTCVKKGISMRSDGDGSQSRDMCYVKNVVDCLIKAAILAEKTKGEIFNVGVGSSVTNLEILNYVKSKYPNSQHHDAPWRIGDVMHTKADINKAKNILSYTPTHSVWDGLEETTAWYEKNWDWLKDL